MIVQEKQWTATEFRERRERVFSEHRKEARYPTHDAAEVRVLPSNGRHLQATIVDISKSGVRLELGMTLLKGSRVEITSRGKLVIFGEVRYCRRVGGVYQAGILIEGVVTPSNDKESHLLEEEIDLYVIGRGLEIPEVLRAKEHISKCDECSRRVAVTIAKLYPRRVKQATIG
jgi:hypothetical protein